MEHEIAIIGGGPSGSTAAIYLAELGFNVCIIEKKVFPREVLCGEFLSREVVKNLKELNLFKRFLDLKPNPINSFAIFYDEKEISTKLDFQAYGLKRSVFDNLLLMNAKEKGVKVYQPYKVFEITKEGSSYKLYLTSSAHSKQIINSKYVIAAYGKRNYLDAKLKRKFTSYKSNLGGIKFHVNKRFLSEVKDRQIQIYAAAGIYCGVNSVSDEEATFCFLEDRKSISKIPLESLQKLARYNSSFKSLVTSELEDVFLQSRVYGSGNIFLGRRNRIEDGVFMIGDTAQVIAPLAGDGIGMAMDSARLLACLFDQKRQKKISDLDLYEMYTREWQKSFDKRLWTALFIQKILLNKTLGKIGITGLQYFPQALNYLIKSTRG